MKTNLFNQRILCGQSEYWKIRSSAIKRIYCSNVILKIRVKNFLSKPRHDQIALEPAKFIVMAQKKSIRIKPTFWPDIRT